MTVSCRPLWFYPPLALAFLVAFSGCTIFPKLSSRAPGKRAFIDYWPPQENTGKLRLAVKDNIDMKGVVTTNGSQYFVLNGKPATKDAPCLEIARERKVDFVGKTNLSEFAVAPSGFNGYFGTPRSPLSSKRKLIPGGSSCGSAVAVALGLADVSFGTDTAGSIRMPAACSGVVGLKTTFGLVPIEGVHPIDPKHLDTVGPLGKDIAHTAQGMDLLERGFAAKYANAVAAQPHAAGIRIGRLRLKGTDPRIDAAVDAALTKAGFHVVQLDDTFRQKWEQATKDGNTLAAAGAWISDGQYRGKYGISGRTKSAILAGRIAYNRNYQPALARREAWQEALADVFEKVDFIALPTMQATPPAIPIDFRIGVLEAVVLKIQNTVAVNFAGNPALAVPVPTSDEDVPVTSLQLVGPRRSEAALLNAGRLVEKAVKEKSESSVASN
jgi:Asp-tRNA(Asn)/Glu-tRNA(Gln) amidotransferase A subunit family amidase